MNIGSNVDFYIQKYKNSFHVKMNDSGLLIQSRTTEHDFDPVIIN